jgi:integrase
MKHLLTDRHYRNAKPTEGRDFQRFADGEGLYLVAFATGGKSWQYRYKYNDKEQTITLKGVHGLKEAREEADRLRKILEAGDDPRILKRVEQAIKIGENAQTFELTAADWIRSEARRKRWTDRYIEDVEASFSNHLADLNPLPVSKIVATITAPILRKVEINGPGMVDRVAQRLYAVMDFAVEEGHIDRNPLPRRRAVKNERRNFPAVTDLPGIGKILRDYADLEGVAESARRAHVLLVFTAQRIAEIVNAPWAEFDLEAGNWEIPRARMKRKDIGRKAHIVPLPPVLLAQLREWREADGKGAVYVCPSVNSRKVPVIAEVVRRVYRHKLGLVEHSPHSWRSAFSTICREAGKDGDVIEAQLDHIVGSQVSSVYDRSQRLELRRELMTWYEATIIAARDGAKVLPLKREA